MTEVNSNDSDQSVQVHSLLFIYNLPNFWTLYIYIMQARCAKSSQLLDTSKNPRKVLHECIPEGLFEFQLFKHTVQPILSKHLRHDQNLLA